MTRPAPPCLVIDDLDAALAHLRSPFREPVAARIEALRPLLLELFDRRGWPRLDHGDFRAWCLERLEPGRPVLLLDKLFAGDRLEGPWRRLDLHRPVAGAAVADSAVAIPEAVGPVTDNGEDSADDAAFDGLPFPHPPVVIDDAAYRGSTLDRAAAWARRRGAAPDRALVAASSPRAVRALARSGLAVEALRPVPDGLDILHARDFFAFLPHAGRRGAAGSGAGAANAPPARLSLVALHRGACLHLEDEPALRRRLLGLGLDVIDLLEDHLGRPARVADAARLGDGVTAAITDPRRPVVATALLRDVFELRDAFGPDAPGDP